MSRFMKPTQGNVGRSINSVRNLIRWLNRQAREAREGNQ